MTYQAENDRLRRCITMAMGCISPLSRNADERLAWHRLLDGLEGREARLPGEAPPRPRLETMKRNLHFRGENTIPVPFVGEKRRVIRLDTGKEEVLPSEAEALARADVLKGQGIETIVCSH